jgi:hypothetical protein
MAKGLKTGTCALTYLMAINEGQAMAFTFNIHSAAQI